jgi:hypothetical protein
MDADKITKITGHRFEGYTPGMLAIEVELFTTGPGSGTIAEAVDALKSVGNALSETDDALRDGLRKIGVSWESTAAERATELISRSAEFAGDAKTKMDDAAQSAFVISEAFTSMVNKLPNPETLRAGDGGLELGDVLASLIGHETDHAEQVRAARAARDQAVDAIKEFQTTAANELKGIKPLDSPQHLYLDDGSGQDLLVGDVGTTATVAMGNVGTPPVVQDPGTASTAAAGAPPKDPSEYPNQGRGTVGPGSVPDNAPRPPRDSQASYHDSPSPRPSAPPPTTNPSSNAPASHPGSSTTASSAPAGPNVVGAVGMVPPVGWQSDGRRPAAPVGQAAPGGSGDSGGSGSSSSTSTGTPNTGPGASKGESSGTQSPQPRGGAQQSGGGGFAAATGGPGGKASAGAPGGRGFFGEGSLGRGFGSNLPPEKLANGRISGVTPPGAPGAPGSASVVGGTPSGVSPTAAANAAGGAAALAASGAVGAAGAEEDKQRRAQQLGKDTVVDGKQLYDFDAGELPNEQEAVAAEKVEPEQAGQQPRYLEQAAMPEGVTDETRVRSHGVDDVDLFADQRMVAPEVIGDERAERGEDR